MTPVPPASGAGARILARRPVEDSSIPGTTSGRATTSSACWRRRHGRGLSGVGPDARSGGGDQNHPAARSAADPGDRWRLEQRFKRELLLARQVTHKNVVRIHDLGEIDGITYITMPYVQGSDLASIISREGPMPRRPRARDREADRRRARRRARGRRDSSRPEAGQHHDRRRRQRVDHGFRHRADTPAGGMTMTVARASARSNTWRPSRRAAKPSISAPTSTPSA